MKKQNKWLAGLSLLVLAGIIVGCGSGNNDSTSKSASSNKTVTVEQLKKAGKIKVGVKEDIPNFGYMNPDTNKNEGMEPDCERNYRQRRECGICGRDSENARSPFRQW